MSNLHNSITAKYHSSPRAHCQALKWAGRNRTPFVHRQQARALKSMQSCHCGKAAASTNSGAPQTAGRRTPGRCSTRSRRSPAGFTHPRANRATHPRILPKASLLCSVQQPAHLAPSPRERHGIGKICTASCCPSRQRRHVSGDGRASRRAALDLEVFHTTLHGNEYVWLWGLSCCCASPQWSPCRPAQAGTCGRRGGGTTGAGRRADFFI